jgi:predicted transcriptional regulator YheO
MQFQHIFNAKNRIAEIAESLKVSKTTVENSASDLKAHEKQ